MEKSKLEEEITNKIHDYSCNINVKNREWYVCIPKVLYQSLANSIILILNEEISKRNDSGAG